MSASIRFLVAPILSGALVVSAVALAGCATQANNATSASDAEAQPQAEVVNPLVSYESAAALTQATGLVPVTAANMQDIEYCALDGTGIAQATGTVGAAQVTSRSKAASASEDISGVYYDNWTATETFVTPAGAQVTQHTLDATVAVFDWFDAAAGVQNCVVVESSTVNAAEARAVFDAFGV